MDGFIAMSFVWKTSSCADPLPCLSPVITPGTVYTATNILSHLAHNTNYQLAMHIKSRLSRHIHVVLGKSQDLYTLIIASY